MRYDLQGFSDFLGFVVGVGKLRLFDFIYLFVDSLAFGCGFSEGVSVYD